MIGLVIFVLLGVVSMVSLKIGDRKIDNNKLRRCVDWTSAISGYTALVILVLMLFHLIFTTPAYDSNVVNLNVNICASNAFFDKDTEMFGVYYWSFDGFAPTYKTRECNEDEIEKVREFLLAESEMYNAMYEIACNDGQ
jgi:hypothetical protein